MQPVTGGRDSSPTTLDIEHLFGLALHRNEQTFASGVPPADDDPRRVKEITTMAMVRVAPVTVQVRTDWFNGVPREVTWGEERLQVTRLVSIRDERRAYPAITGPRTLFEVDTPSMRLALTFQHRSRRWTIEGMDGLDAAA
jgi:hypothetical protein